MKTTDINPTARYENNDERIGEPGEYTGAEILAVIDGDEGEWDIEDAESTTSLHDYETSAYLRPATIGELRDSISAARHDGGAGVISVDGRRCYVL